jgi:hypothetical protein
VPVLSAAVLVIVIEFRPGGFASFEHEHRPLRGLSTSTTFHGHSFCPNDPAPPEASLTTINLPA